MTRAGINSGSRARLTLSQIQPYIARAREFSGWEFPEIHETALEPEPPWDYADLVRRYGPRASSVLDMGTGGGEFLAGVRDYFPHFAVATEEWEVNAPIAHKRLAPAGVPVVRSSSLKFPFHDRSFDLILNRHEELNPAEVARVLRPGGHIITQQIGRNHWQELRRHFPSMTDFGDIRSAYVQGFQAAGLQVLQSLEHDHRFAYPNLGELVYMMLISPWSFPGFDPERELDALIAVEGDNTCEQGIALTASYFLIVAVKPTQSHS